MRVLFVDDEKRARETLIQICKLCCPDMTLFEEASSVAIAVSMIRTSKPDILFLDISLGDGTGFDVLQQVNDSSLNVIFVTAHHEYGIRALKASAIDYLLKPVRTTELMAAVAKAKERLSQQDMGKHLESLLLNWDNKKKEIDRIVVKTTESIYLINVAEIIFCESDKGYTTFHLIHQRKILSSKILSEYEAILPNSFMRIHQSYLVNLKHIVRYDKRDSKSLITIEEHELPVSTRKRTELMDYLDGLAQ